MFGGLILGLQAISTYVQVHQSVFSSASRDWTSVVVACWIVIVAVCGVAFGVNRRRASRTPSNGTHRMSALWLFRWVVTGTAALLAADVILNGLTSNSHHSMILGGFTARWHLAQHARLGFLILTVALAVAQVALVWLTQLGKRRSVAIASEVVLWLSLGLAVHWSVPVATSCIQLGPPPESCFSETVGFPSAGWITISVMIGVVIGLVWSICSSHQEEVDDRSVPVEAA